MSRPSTTSTPHRRLQERQARLESRYGQGCPYLPDAVKDTTNRRRRRAAILLGDGCGPFSRLYSLKGGRLYHLVMKYHVEWDFYVDASSQIKLSLERLLGTAPRYVFAARSKAGVIHAHVLVHLKAVPDDWVTTPEETLYIVPVNDDAHFTNLAEYFSRPHDERAERVNPEDLKLYTPDQLWFMRLDAAEDYLAARERHIGQRLPALSWPSYIPELRPDSPDPTIAQRVILKRLASRLVNVSPAAQQTSLTRSVARPSPPAPTSPQALPRARAPPTSAGHQQASTPPR